MFLFECIGLDKKYRSNIYLLILIYLFISPVSVEGAIVMIGIAVNLTSLIIGLMKGPHPMINIYKCLENPWAFQHKD